MMGQYGIFGTALSELDHALGQVRSVWVDKTAQTYNSINENMEVFAQRMWNGHQSAAAGDQAVRENYKEEEFDSILGSLSSRINQL